MGTLKGKNLMVSIKGTVYGFATSCDINVDVDTKEVSSGSWKHSSAKGNWKEYETERTGWTINTEHLVAADMADVDALFGFMTTGDAVDVEYVSVTEASSTSGKAKGETGTLTAGKGWSGKAIITSMKISAQDGSDATYSISLQGTGELKKKVA